MKDLEKLEDCRLPEVGSEKVKKCMQDAVERVWHKYLIARALNNCNTPLLGERKEVNIRTIEEYLHIFTDLGDCDFENPLSINSFFKELIDVLLIDIDERTVLNIFNNAYAIALHALNNDYPEYSIGDYSDIITETSPNIITQEMVLAMVLTLTHSNKDSNRAFNILADKYNIRKQHLIAGRIRKTFPVIEKCHLQLYNIDQIGELDYSQSMNKIQLRKKKAETLDELKAIINGMVPQQQGLAPTYTLLDAIVRYAEALPADECSAIRAIGRMLHAKGAAGRYIPSEMYREYEQRIDRLANWPKPEQREAPLPAPHPGGEVQEEEPQEVLPAAPAATPVPEPSTQKERIKAAISRLLDRRREDGVKFCAKHWYAVYRVLAARELVVENMKAFAELMNEMGFSDCKRSNLNSAQKEQKLPAKISEWFGRTRYEGGDKKLADVAQAFVSILREDNL